MTATKVGGCAHRSRMPRRSLFRRSPKVCPTCWHDRDEHNTARCMQCFRERPPLPVPPADLANPCADTGQYFDMYSAVGSTCNACGHNSFAHAHDRGWRCDLCRMAQSGAVPPDGGAAANDMGESESIRADCWSVNGDTGIGCELPGDDGHTMHRVVIEWPDSESLPSSFRNKLA